MENKYIQYKNKNIYYRIIGKGKPVMLIHGFCEDGSIWNEVIKDLQNNFQFIIPDLPGSGKSEILEGDTLPTGRQISIKDYAEVIKYILDEELPNVFPVEGDLEGAITLIGHSMGGYITLAFAEKYPKLLNGIGLFHSSAFADDESKKENRNKAINFIKENGAYAFLKTSIPTLFTDNQHPSIEKLIESGKNFIPEALMQYQMAMINRPDRTHVLKTFKKPVLFIIGEKDNAIPLQISLQQCSFPSLIFMYILENSGHMGMLEDIDRCKELIDSFLQNL